MSPRYESVRTAAWLPLDTDASAVGRYRVMPFPEQWRGRLLDLCSAGRDKPAEYVPTFRMDQVVQALAPDVLVRPRPSAYLGESPDFWFYVPEDVPDPLPAPALRTLVKAWLRDLRPEREHRALREEVQEALLSELPTWQQGAAVELLRCTPTPGDTAAPDPRQFQLTTDWLARRILELPPFPYEGGSLRFRAVPRGPRDQGAELVSQALPFESGRTTGWFSVVLNITLHTVPFDPLPRLHLHSHIRRYATAVSSRTGRLHLPYGRRTTVLLRPRVPWLPQAPASDRFASARLAWSRDGHDWVLGGPAGMLRGMSLRETFPQADAILSDPEGWLKDDMRAAVVHATAMGSHPVGTGLMPHQRSQIVEWAEQALPPQLRPAPLLMRTRLSGSRPANPRQEPSEPSRKALAERERTEARRLGTAFALTALAPGAASPLSCMPICCGSPT
ncbi:DUF3962 domain-containing protein [Streptomyces sp. MST-110588]|uniref:pPIWI_RE module domain-containing protein n=1 Tax=Streptomyces sp. MST-110588 TaxID=2833628 RepID=UPI001F5C3A82|nr:DUF3962 domain-containing protein [Streptomyces sp. MST-110588]UNO39417.1 DUF3962 domain-containing protein [Streptomyces sp. MST-110588]